LELGVSRSGGLQAAVQVGWSEQRQNLRRKTVGCIASGCLSNNFDDFCDLIQPLEVEIMLRTLKNTPPVLTKSLSGSFVVVTSKLLKV
jgi:hypothetical protein